LSIEDIKEALDIVDFNAGSTAHLRRHDAERRDIIGPSEAAPDGRIHDVAVWPARSTGFPGKRVRDVVVQGEGGSL